jgi:hypothetical protein
VVEYNLLILMRRHVFVVELGVKVGIDRGDGLVFGKDVRERNGFVVLLLALFGEAFGAYDFGVGIRLIPGTKEDVMLVLLSDSAF